MSIPNRLNADTPTGKSQDERDLLEYAHRLWDEGKDWRESKRHTKDVEQDRRTYRGTLHPRGHKEGRLFTINIVQAFIDRMVAQLTDNRPIMRVESIIPEMDKMANAIEKYIANVVWEESRAQRQLFRIAHTAAIEGSAGCCVSYSNITDAIAVEMLYPEQLSIHRTVVEAGLMDEAEAITIRRDVPLSWIRQRFPYRGGAVKADVSSDSAKEKGIISTPIDELARKGGKKGTSDAVPMARMYEQSFIDRESKVKGVIAFPTRRRIIFTHEVILDDGPLPYWDGLPQVDLFDWAVDPEHPWGLSATSLMRAGQIAFNEVLDGNIKNQSTLNMINLMMDHNALDRTQVADLRRMKNINIMSHRKNASVRFDVPPSFGQGQMALAREIFSYLQAVTGVTDVTLGESPGSLQSGTAIEGLQQGANLMTRARASRLEDFISRVGQKIVARIIQFVSTEKMEMFLGQNDETAAYSKGLERFEVMTGDQVRERAKLFRLLRFAIVPGSSAPGTKQARAQAMLGLHLLPRPLVSGKDVLEAADFRNAEDMIKRAQIEVPPPQDDDKQVSPGILQQVPPIFSGAK